MNVWTITGNLGQDPRLRTTNNGESVLNLNVAVRKRVKNGDRWEDVTMWVDVTLWGKRAEGVAGLLAKGSRVGASGELGVREYVDKNNTPRWQLELNARELDVLESRDERLGREQGQGGTRAGTNAYGGGQQQRGSAGTHRDQFRGDPPRTGGRTPDQGGFNYEQRRGSYGGANQGAGREPQGGGFNYTDPDDDIPF